MSKVKIEELKVFPAVAAVIGVARAKIELFKLQGVECGFDDDEYLGLAFVWGDTVQGHFFWDDINGGINPYDK